MINKKPSNIRINKVYTRSGDSGKTRIIGGIEKWKDDIRIEAYGTVDELNSEIGLCREMLIEINNKDFNHLVKILLKVQNELFNLGTQLAAAENTEGLPKLSKNAIILLEKEIDKTNKNLNELSSFILPGGSILNARFHIARNICRRAERRAVSLLKVEKINLDNIRFLNRLSDALFVWSRLLSSILGNPEILWDPNN